MNQDEKQYAELNAKFHKELTELEAEMERLDKRHQVLHTLLFGTAEEVKALQPLEEEPKVATLKGTNLKAKTIEPFDGLVKFLKANPGSRRHEIAEFLDLDEVAIKRLLEKAKRQNAVVNSGRGRASVWYVAGKPKEGK